MNQFLTLPETEEMREAVTRRREQLKGRIATMDEVYRFALEDNPNTADPQSWFHWLLYYGRLWGFQEALNFATNPDFVHEAEIAKR